MPDISLPPWLGAVLFGWIFIAAIGAFIFGRIYAMNRRGNDDIYDDPDKTKRTTTEDEWRRAYAESDGDHRSYVKWRSGR